MDVGCNTKPGSEIQHGHSRRQSLGALKRQSSYCRPARRPGPAVTVPRILADVHHDVYLALLLILRRVGGHSNQRASVERSITETEPVVARNAAKGTEVGG